MSDEPRPDGVKRDRLEVFSFERPRCQYCGCVKLKKNRSVRDQGDGSSAWWVQCLNPECVRRFKVVLE